MISQKLICFLIMSRNFCESKQKHCNSINITISSTDYQQIVRLPSYAEVFIKHYPGYYKIENFLQKLATCSCNPETHQKYKRKSKRISDRRTGRSKFKLVNNFSESRFYRKLTPYRRNLNEYRLEKAKQEVHQKHKVKAIHNEMVFKRLRDDPGLGEHKQNLLENAKFCEVYTHFGLGWKIHVKNDITWFPINKLKKFTAIYKLL